MKSLLQILFLCSIFWNISPDTASNRKVIDILKEKGFFKKIKENYRKLEGTDQSIDEYSDSSWEEIIDFNGTTNVTELVDDNKSASIQILSFANYEQIEQQIQFDVFVYYLNRVIAKYIVMPLKIKYSKRIRNLEQEIIEEYIDTNCTIQNESLIGQEGTGDIIDYNCQANTSTESVIQTASIVTDRPLIIDNETVSLKEVNFNGNSSEESINIQECTQKVLKAGVLKRTEVEFPVQINYIRLGGTLSPPGLFKKDEKINMTFLNYFNGKRDKNTYECFAKEINPKCIIECNTENQPINSTIHYFHISTGYIGSYGLLTIDMNNWENNNTSIETPIRDNRKNENITADEEAFIVDEKAPFSKIAKKYDNKKAPFQINFFSNFIRDNQKRSINFKSFFYFLNRKIANIIFFRLRVTYSRNLRNLQQEANAESIPCECTIIDEDLVDKEGKGDITSFDCSATTLTNSNLDNVAINTDIPMIIIDGSEEIQTIEFNNINFNGYSSSQSENLQNILNVSKSGTLEDTEVKLPPRLNYFRLTGTLNPADLLEKDEEFPVTFLEYSYGEKTHREYKCKVTQTEPKCSMECDTRNQTITSTIQDLHLSSGISNSNNLLTIKMNNWENNDTLIETKINTESTLIRNRKNSGGLTNGAIAGIIIACAAGIAAVIITFIISKKATTTNDPRESKSNLNMYSESQKQIINQNIVSGSDKKMPDPTKNPKIFSGSDKIMADPKENPKIFSGSDKKMAAPIDIK